MQIETEFFILSQEQYDQLNTEAQDEGVSLDYYLFEFCNVIGEEVTSH
jgi:hypothetical protein